MRSPLLLGVQENKQTREEQNNRIRTIARLITVSLAPRASCLVPHASCLMPRACELCKNHYPGKKNSSQLPKRLSMKKRNLSTKKNVKSICPVCPSSRSFHPALKAYLRSFGRKEPLDLALPHPSPDTTPLLVSELLIAVM